ncbi:MAG: NIPSNAP family protein [Actinomycetota bacterium]|nr:NIPSNAP family protein [Actinomycetota bacterium]
MSVEVHVDGRIIGGQLSAFVQGLERYLAYARAHGYEVPTVLQGLSGPMNSIRLVYRYESLASYEEHEARTLSDPGYAQAASAMELVDGTVAYSIFREIE